MITKRVTMGALAGGAVLLVLNYLIFEVAFAAFFAANAGSASGVPRSANLWWALALGNLSLAALVTLAIRWAAASTVLAGFKIGAIVGFLAWFGVIFACTD